MIYTNTPIMIMEDTGDTLLYSIYKYTYLKPLTTWIPFSLMKIILVCKFVHKIIVKIITPDRFVYSSLDQRYHYTRVDDT